MKKLKKLILGMLIISRAFWKSTIEITWGFAAILLFRGLLLQYQIDLSHGRELLKLTIILLKYWVFFWLGFYILNLYDNFWRMREGEEK